MRLTVAQYALILGAEDDCIRCTAHQPETAFDQLPMFDVLAQLQVLWHIAKDGVQYD